MKLSTSYLSKRDRGVSSRKGSILNLNLAILNDFCSMKVRMGTFQTGPRRKPTRESKTHSSSADIVARLRRKGVTSFFVSFFSVEMLPSRSEFRTPNEPKVCRRNLVAVMKETLSLPPSPLQTHTLCLSPSYTLTKTHTPTLSLYLSLSLSLNVLKDRKGEREKFGR